VDNLVLIRVASVFERTLADAVVREFGEESDHGFRLLLDSEARPRSVVISLEPASPWMGRPAGRGRLPRRAPGRFAAVVARALRGSVLRRVEKPPAERRVTFHFADGGALVAELVPHRSNLVLVNASGAVVTAARRRRRDRERLTAGRPYRTPPMPRGRLDPFVAGEDEIRARLRSGAEAGRDPSETLARELAGIGREAAGMLAEEARREHADLATLVRERLAEIATGARDPVIETTGDPLEAAERGRFDEIGCRLLPWDPPWPPAGGARRLSRDDAAVTAGLFHAAARLAWEGRRRLDSLIAILEREIRHLREVEAKVGADVAAFDDPDRHRRAGEALLAGLKDARRAGDHVMVRDPYDPEGGLVPVEVDPGMSLPRAAEACFARHRRAVRGLERARERRGEVAGRRKRLEALHERYAGRTGAEAAEALERDMQREGIPVGLERATGRKLASAAGTGRARVEGVRLFLSRDADPVLVGKTGKDNQRLTFKLASPEDFWLHALGVPGAHVVVRNDRRRKRPSEATLKEAAEAAAWFSEAREQPRADVQWTRRKYVRKVRGAPAGTVRVKRFETIRVRPRRPGALEGGA
jgi:predicted ribosome quality control (RQC) complex YloA/Tae2 family protein